MGHSDESIFIVTDCSEEDDLLFLLQAKHKQTLKRLQDAYRETEYIEQENERNEIG